MKPFVLGLLFACALVSQVRQGLPARSGPAGYPGKAEGKDLVIAAEVMDPEQVRNEFATPLTATYQVLEVAIYPKKGSTIDLFTIDFGLRVDGRLLRPADPSRIAARNQRKANERRKDITLWPAVGVSTGTWGTGTNVGVGVGVGDAPPGPGSTDRDRHVMQTELDDRALQDGAVTKPVAGYLYFPVGEAKSDSVELIYEQDGSELRIPLTLPKKK
jgi:hypothetical protein